MVSHKKAKFTQRKKAKKKAKKKVIYFIINDCKNCNKKGKK